MNITKIGNGEAYSFFMMLAIENSPLKGKNICILGSSVAYGSTSDGMAVGEYLSARFDAQLTKEAVAGTTLTDIGEMSYIQRMKRNIPTDQQFNLFICQLSTNDSNDFLDIPLGQVSESTELDDLDTSTITGAIEYIICYARRHWNCPIAFFTGSRFDSPKYARMVEQLLRLKKKWGICVLDLWTDDVFNDITQQKRVLYMNDPVHPLKAGYRDWWGPEVERQLLAYLAV